MKNCEAGQPASASGASAAGPTSTARHLANALPGSLSNLLGPPTICIMQEFMPTFCFYVHSLHTDNNR